MTRNLPEIRKISALMKTRLQHKKAHAKERVAKGFSSYTVVSAVYNVEKYLHDFFTSMVRQTLDFENNIYLIMVDDGSTDRSADIIKSWQKRYPKNITYLYKENGGQASARNMGLPLVKTEWVTFTDPDDFVDKNYFSAIDSGIKKYSTYDLSSATCPITVYFEKENIKKDHALNYRFKSNILLTRNEDIDTPLASSTRTFFKHNKICKNLIQFDERIATSFEDGKFALEYAGINSKSYTIFVKDAEYIYRKRQGSTIDKAWQQQLHYIEDIFYGEMHFVNSQKTAVSPYKISTLLYSLSWHIKYFLDREDRLPVLNQITKGYLAILRFIFNYIDSNSIYNLKTPGTWFLHKVCIMHFIKNETFFKNFIYIEGIDLEQKTIKIMHFDFGDYYEYSIGRKMITPIISKRRIHTFCGLKAVIEKKIYIKVDDLESHDTIAVSGHKNRYILNGTQYDKLSICAIKNSLATKTTHNSADTRFNNCWIFMDRDIWADDNAEVLYHHIRHKHPEINSWFVVRKSSNDWKRLSKLPNVKLIDFLSEDYTTALRHCKYFISSQADIYLFNTKENIEHGFKFIFLQHGVIKDDISQWLNNKQFSVFVTSTFKEFEYIVGDSKFKFSRNEVCLCGLPRHDRLYTNQSKPEFIVIMPTWRKSLSTQVSKFTDEKRPNLNFYSSKYFAAWKSLLSSKTLKVLSTKYNYKILLCPHVNLVNFIDDFDVPEHIEIFKHNSNIKISEIFKSSVTMITDSSSAAFEMAYMYKEVIYFQFDMDELFGGGHIAQRGYFDYARDGFGPVAETEEALLYELEVLLKNDGKPAPEYRRRMERTFPFRDGRCCERVYNAICRLEKPQRDYFSEIACLYDQAVSASRHDQRVDAIELWKRFYDVSSSDVQDTMTYWAQAYF